MAKNSTTLKKTYSKTALLLIVILLFMLIFKILSDGFKINDLSIAGIKIEGLYLKLNQKLVLDIENLDLGDIKNDSDESHSIGNIERVIKQAILFTSFFEKLSIKRIIYANETSSIYFDGNQYIVNIPNILASFRLSNNNDNLVLNIDELIMKRENINIIGSIMHTKENKSFSFDLEMFINNNKNNVVSITGETNFKYINASLNTTKLNSINTFAPYIKQWDYHVYEWIYEKSKFDSLYIDKAYVKINNIKSKHLDNDIVNSLYVSGFLDKALLKIDEQLDYIAANKVHVIFNKGKLDFFVKNATYNDTIVDSGQVELSQFLDKQMRLKINIKSKQARLNNDISNILNHYGINLPIIQTSGFGDGFINLNILLPTHDLQAHVTPNGFFHIKESNVNIGGAEIFIKEADLYINDEIITITDSMVQFMDIIDSKIAMIINTQNKTINAIAQPKYFKIIGNNGYEIINFEETVIRAGADFSQDDIRVLFDDFDFEVTLGKEINAYINDISKFMPYAPILTLLDINSGDVELNIRNDYNWKLNANIKNLNYPIYDLDGNKINEISVTGSSKDNHIALSDTKDRIKLEIKKDSGDMKIDANNIMVDISEIMESTIPLFKNINDDSNKGDSIDIAIDINNSRLKLFKYQFDIDNGVLKTNNSGFYSNLKYKNGNAYIILNNGTISIDASNFNDEFINKTFNKELVSGGTFELYGIYKDSRFLGDLIMSNTSVKNMASLQNILTLVDTIPSLIVFKVPGFSTNGYEIEDAKIRIGADNEFIVLENIQINGSSVDIEGNGIVSMVEEDINMQLTLSTMKSLSSILNKIPIVGYLLLGEDGKITTEMSINGKIDNPTTKLSLLEDTMKTPVNIIKRIFTPFQILVDELKKDRKEKK